MVRIVQKQGGIRVDKVGVVGRASKNEGPEFAIEAHEGLCVGGELGM